MGVKAFYELQSVPSTKLIPEESFGQLNLNSHIGLGA